MNIGKNIKLISHRGNIRGTQPGLENTPEYIEDTNPFEYTTFDELLAGSPQIYIGNNYFNLI